MSQPRGNFLVIVAVAAALTGCGRTPQQSFDKGVAYFKAQKFAKAADQFEQAIQHGTPTAQAWNFLGVCQLQTDAPDAIKAFQAALELDHAYLPAHYNLALAYLEAGQPEQSLAHLRQLPQSTLAPPDTQYYLGRAYLHAGALAQAKHAFEKATDTDAAAEVFNELGVVNARLGNPKQAKEDFEQAIKARPDYAPAYFNLAVVEHSPLGLKPAAVQHYQKYLDLSPKTQQRDEILAIVAQLTQEPAPRPKPVEVVVPPPPKPQPVVKPAELAPPEPAPVVRTEPAPAPVVTAPPPAPVPAPAPVPPPKPVVKRRTPVALPTFKAGNRAKAKAYFNEGIAGQQQAKLTTAIASYAKAIAADPTFAQAYYNLAIAYRDTHQPDKALDNYELALATNPDFTDARFNYAILLQQEGYVVDALTQYEKLLENSPNDASVHLTVATLYARDRDTKAKARQHYQTYLKLVPNSPMAKDIRDWLSKNP